jgi:transposase-like protein
MDVSLSSCGFPRKDHLILPECYPRCSSCEALFCEGAWRWSHWNSPRHYINKNAVYTKVHNELKAERTIQEMCELLQKRYRNTIVEQDPRLMKRLVKPGIGFFSFQTAMFK